MMGTKLRTHLTRPQAWAKDERLRKKDGTAFDCNGYGYHGSLNFQRFCVYLGIARIWF